MDTLTVLGNRVRELRLKRGYSQEVLAEKAGLHRTYIGAVERGERNLSIKSVARIAAALDVSLSELFDCL